MLQNFINRLKGEWRTLQKFRKVARIWFKIKKIFMPTFSILTIVLSLFLVAYNQISASRIYEGISIPDPEEEIKINLDIANDNISIEIPYKIENGGFHSVNHLSIEFVIYLEFKSKDSTRKESLTILEKSEDLGYILPGKMLQGTFEIDDFDDAGWKKSNLIEYSIDVENPNKTKYFMNFIINFVLQDLEEITILYEDIELETKEANKGDDDNNVDEDSQFDDKTKPYKVYRSGISLPFVIIVVAYFFTATLMISRSQKREKEGINIKKTDYLEDFDFLEPSEGSGNVELKEQEPIKPKIKLEKFKKFFLKRKNLFIALLQIAGLTGLSIFLYLFSLHQQKTTVIENASTGDYEQRFELATWWSIGLLILIGGIALVPVLTPKMFPPYSIKKGVLNLVNSILSLAITLIWAFYTSVIAYNIESSTIVRNTFVSFVPFIAFILIRVGVKCVDLGMFVKYRKDFEKKRQEKGFYAKKQRIKALKKAQELILRRGKPIIVSRPLSSEYVREESTQVEGDKILVKCPHCEFISEIMKEEVLCPVCGRNIREVS
ncbi:MAG: hypothetical protein ACFFAN_10530 [Promethearchaeota archaeon]